MANRFELAAALGRGTITPAQERFLISQPIARLGEYRRRLRIFGAIPRLSKRQAWRLIAAITSDSGGAV